MSLSILALTPQNCDYEHIFTYTFNASPLFLEKPGHAVFQLQDQNYKSMGPEKEVIHLVMVISRPSDDHRLILSSSTKITFVGSQLLIYLRIKAFALDRTYIC